MESNYKKLNYRRIAVIRDDLVDCLHRLDVSYKKLTSSNCEEDLIIGRGAFMCYIIN